MKRFARLVFTAAFFLLTVNAAVQAQGVSGKTGTIKRLLAQCDSVKNNIMLAVADHGLLLRKLGFEGLHLVPIDDAENRSQFFYYIASGFVFQEPIIVDTVSYYFLKSLDEARKTKSARLVANVATSMMHIGFEMQNDNETETYKNILQSIVDTTKDIAVLQSGYAALGTYYQQKSYYNTAQDYFLKSITLQQKQPLEQWNTKDKTDFANRCYTLAQLYLNIGTFDKALATLNTGRPFAASSYLIDMRYKTLLLDVFSKLGNIDSALYYLHNYIDPITDKFNDRATVPDFIMLCNLSVSRYYLDKNENEKAWPYLEKLNAYPADKIEPFESYKLQEAMGRYYEQTGNFPKAIPLFAQALPVARQFSKEEYTDLLKYMAIAYQGAGKLSKSLQFYKAFNESLDSLTKEKLSRNFADQQTRYETNQKEQQIVSLDKENRLNTLQLQNAARTKWLLLLGLVAAGVIALLFYFIYRNREKLNKQLNLQKAELQLLNGRLSIANDTKAKLFGIISHDLRSPVSTIAQLMQLQKEHPEILDEQAVKKYETKIKKATENVLETMEDLLLWSKSQMQQFTADEKPVNIHDVMIKECDVIHTAMEEKNITINNQLLPDYVQVTDENFIAVIIRNLLQNAIKYSDVNSIITIAASNNQLSIVNAASDIDSDIVNEQLKNKQVNSKSSGLGLQIISDLALQLNVQVFFEKQDDTHLAAIIRFTN